MNSRLEIPSLCKCTWFYPSQGLDYVSKYHRLGAVSIIDGEGHCVRQVDTRWVGSFVPLMQKLDER